MVDEQPLRRRWVPTDEAGLRESFSRGIFEERNWCDLKREIGSTRGATTSLAQDLAAMAVDGGTIIIGLDEKAPEGNPLHPVLLRGLSERIEQVAYTRVRPPLLVETTEVPSAADAEHGYLVAHVPASPLAPHQVDGTYYGRGDKTNLRLSDAEVERLFARRKSWGTDPLIALNELMTYTIEWNGGHQIPRLYILAKPVAAWPEIMAPIVASRDWSQQLQRLRDRVRNDDALNTDLLRHFQPAQGWLSIVGSTPSVARTAFGCRITSGPMVVWRDLTGSNDLDINESGSISLVVSTISVPDQNMNAMPYTAVRIDELVVAVMELLAIVRMLSADLNYVGMWEIALGLTNLGKTRTIRTAPLGTVFGGGLRRGYEAANFIQSTRASAVEVERAPVLILQRLVGGYLRGTEDDDYLDQLLDASDDG